MKLIEGLARRTKYATLSHCWGGQLSCITTTKNYQERMAGMPWEEIPRTFRDAIRYCVELGIFYLWIDALCIVQDDTTDWQTESAEMANIYQNSHITLAATSARDGNVGCFPKDMATNTESATIRVKCFDGKLRFVGTVRSKLPHWGDLVSAAASLERYPLLTRGWVFQERVLSPRVLHFSHGELIWECGVETVCECGSLTDDRSLKEQFSRVKDMVPNRVLTNRNSSMIAYRSAGAVQLNLGPKDFLSSRYHNIFFSRHDNTSGSERSLNRDAIKIQSLLRNSMTMVSHLVSARTNLHEIRSLEYRTEHLDLLGSVEPDTQHMTLIEAEAHLRSAQSSYSQRFQRLVTKIPKTDQDKMTDLWQAIVTRFSSLQLTKATDRLPALSGLAERMEPFLGEYIAGLWGPSMAFDMAWRVQHLSPGSQRLREYRGPSWSWVSVDAKVVFWTKADMSTLSIFTRLGEDLPDEFYAYISNEPSPEASGSEEQDAILGGLLFLRDGLILPRAFCGCEPSRPLKPCEYYDHAAQKPTRLKKPPPTISVLSCKITRTGRNPYGEVSSAVLTVMGLTRPARLSDDSAVLPTKEESYPLPLKVEINFDHGKWKVPPTVSSLTLPFFADYDLTSEGPNKIPANSKVLLLALFEDISVVLIKEQFSMKGVEVYRRIGILKLSEEYMLMYGLSLGQGSQRRIITVI